MNPDLAVIDFLTFAKQVDGNFTQQAMIAKLTSLFGFLALVLASIGLYGVTAYSVERRTNEIGIRMALGADRMSVLKLVLRGALAQMAIALAIGIPVTIAAGHAMAAQLFGVKPYDPRILAGHHRRAGARRFSRGGGSGSPRRNARPDSRSAHGIGHSQPNGQRENRVRR